MRIHVNAGNYSREQGTRIVASEDVPPRDTDLVVWGGTA